ncbi:hypothetical protein ACYCVF_31215 [Bradyrhizobium sp. 1.29L]
MSAKLVGDGAGVLASEAESFQEPLARRRHLDPDLALIVAYDRRRCQRMCRRLVLDDFESANSGALIATSAEEKPTVRGLPQECRRGGREISGRVEIMCGAHGVGQDRRVDIGIGLGIDPADELN